MISSFPLHLIVLLLTAILYNPTEAQKSSFAEYRPQPSGMKPTIIFVHGAWHSPDCFDKVIAFLSERDYYTRKVHLPSVGRSVPVTSTGPDTDAVRRAVLAETTKGRDVTVVCHSYGGIPASQALQGLGKPSSPDRKGRVVSFVYLTAFMPLEGLSISNLSAQHPDTKSVPLDVTPEGNLVVKKDPSPVPFFYGDLSPEEAAYWVTRLEPQAAATFGDPLKYAAWKDIPTFYLFALKDMAIPIDIQRGFVKDARDLLDKEEGPGTGRRRISTEEIDSSHSVFLSHPDETAAYIQRAASYGTKRF